MKIDVRVPDGKSGDWEVSTFTVTEEQANLENLRATFSHSSRSILPGTYKRLTRNGSTIMSNTPMEISDHSRFISKAKKSEYILINGLGLGVALEEILKSDVPKVVVVLEKSEDLIKLVAPSFSGDERVSIIHADALTFKFSSATRFDVVWHDIWDSICSDNLPEMHKLHRKYGRKSTWQGSWCRDLCERQKRQSKVGWSW